MPPDVKELFGGTPFFALGEYRVAHVDVKDARGTIQRMTLIVNRGVEGMQFGFWGGAFDRHPPHLCLARFQGASEGMTTIVQRKNRRSPLSFSDYANLEFADSICSAGTTQLEQLVGVAVEFLLFHADWQGLPPSLIEIRDQSPRNERARQRTSTTPRNKRTAFHF